MQTDFSGGKLRRINKESHYQMFIVEINSIITELMENTIYTKFLQGKIKFEFYLNEFQQLFLLIKT